MKDLYLIPGLGADHRVFDFLELSGYQSHVISWIEPLSHEPIEGYTARLSAQIKSDSPIIIGVSFGGMIAIEMGKQLNADKIILISSARTKKEIPWYARILGKMLFHKLAPTSWLKNPGRLLFYFFSVKSLSEKKLLTDIVRNTDRVFLTWAIDKIFRWNNTVIPKNTILIQGSQDRLFPNIVGDIVIAGGGHFMIVNKAVEVSQQLKRTIN